jgi:hypothetical protein
MSNNTDTEAIAYFISPHGFGHAARASAVMNAVHAVDPTIRFEIFTTVPPWFFEESLTVPYAYHTLQTDVGLVQDTPLRADLERTVEALGRLIPFDGSQLSQLAREMDRLGCALVVSDIAPMGVAVAREAGLPSILVENFTWDWVYDEYADRHRALKGFADYFKAIVDAVDYHIQAEPICSLAAGSIVVAPVSRATRRPRETVRQGLELPDHAKMVLITMGGVPQAYDFLDRQTHSDAFYVVVPGGSETVRRNGHLILLPHRSPFFHPDLILAADVVIGKVGYSTVAEVYHGGAPFGFIKRPDFRESDILAAYIEDQMSGLAIEEAAFQTGGWMASVPRLLEMPRIRREAPNGAAQIAAVIRNVI